MTGADKILVIKLSALGDFIQATGPFQAIRKAFPDSHITLLTTKPYKKFAEDSCLFDQVWLDSRPKIWQFGKLKALKQQLRSGDFDRVFDLQTSDRSSSYFRLFPKNKRPLWSGIAKGCSHPHSNDRRDFMHTLDRQREQLNMAGLDDVPAPSLAWMQADVTHFGLAEPYALLVPGGSAHRPEKRWPIEAYAELAKTFLSQGIQPVILGGPDEQGLAEPLMAAVPEAVNLIGQTSFEQIAVLARGAQIAVGNDTGPMHIIAVEGCPSVVLFSDNSNPGLCAPRGDKVVILQKSNLADLPVSEVLDALPGQ